MSVDYSHDPQHEKLFRNPMIQRCLSLQNTLGYKGELNHRSLTAKIAWATLHLRLAALTFAITFNNVKSTSGGGAENDYTRPGRHTSRQLCPATRRIDISVVSY